jgi:hypothetical protein
MIYKFRSKATGDLIMLGPNGDRMLRLIGREPATKGIIEVADMAAAVDALQAAVRAEQAPANDECADGDDDPRKAERITLRQRLWPMIQMLDAARAAGEPVVWGV